MNKLFYIAMVIGFLVIVTTAAALAGQTCTSYCGTFAGHKWCTSTCR